MSKEQSSQEGNKQRFDLIAINNWYVAKYRKNQPTIAEHEAM
jgi:hypothetical protein